MARSPGSSKASGSKAAKAPPKGAAKKAGKGAKPKGRAKGGSALRRFGAWVGRVLLGALLGVLVGGGAVLAGLYRAALQDVDRVVAGPVWSSSGRVLSGPQVVWTGLAYSADELAEDLVAAGYVRASKIGKAGDFQVSEDAVMVSVPPAKGAGWSSSEGEVLVTFREGRVSSVSPKGRATFAPAELAAVRGSQNETRRSVPLAEIPDIVVKSVLAMEDSRFYDHEGVDPIGITRALVVNVVRGNTVQGGSTLTQQLAKNLFLSSDRTIERKAHEALLAVALERRLSKNEVLELYLNGVYLGQADGASVYGVDQAARAFFGKPVARLDVGEAATLGGIISAPNRYGPLQHPDKAQERRDIALSRLVDVGWLDPAAAAAAKKQPLVTSPAVTGRDAPWAVDAAVAALEESMGAGSVAARGVTVQTTIQPALQRLAERVVRESLAELDRTQPKAKGAEMALVAVRASDGAIVAMVGGRDYARSPFNRALVGRRQVGSTVKPLTAVFAFEEDEDLSPATVFDDSPIDRVEDGKPWHPKNYDGAFLGPIPLRKALTQSRNIPAILLSERVGMKSLEKRWKGLGLTGATAWKSSALGGFDATPAELAGAYTVFPTGGLWRRPLLVRHAADSDGEVLWSEEPVTARRASARAAWLTSTILEDVLVTGTGSSAPKYGATGAVAGKSGTTDNTRDAWFAGYSRDLVVVVWVGFDKGRDLGLSGGQAALPAWARFMAGTGTLSGSFQPPADVERATVCEASRLPNRPACPATATEWFSRGHVPSEPCPTHAGPIQAVGAAATSIWDRITGQEETTTEPKKRRGLFGRNSEG